MIKPTELCKLALKYGADKCPQISHNYTPFYYEYLKNKRQSIKKVLEVGVGTSARQGKNISNYQVGASLRMWRDFFPNAQVYGADNAPECIFKDERLETFYCDETKKEDIVKLLKNTGTNIDLVVDDASHHIQDQIFLFQTLMPLLDKGVIYIVEDCLRTRMIRKIFPQYNCYIPNLSVYENPKREGLAIFT